MTLNNPDRNLHKHQRVVLQDTLLAGHWLWELSMSSKVAGTLGTAAPSGGGTPCLRCVSEVPGFGTGAVRLAQHRAVEESGVGRRGRQERPSAGGTGARITAPWSSPVVLPGKPTLSTFSPGSGQQQLRRHPDRVSFRWEFLEGNEFAHRESTGRDTKVQVPVCPLPAH